MSHPYRDLPAERFWSRSVAAPAAHEIDPVVGSWERIGADDPVATLGSCFAQHLARFLARSGLNYLVADEGQAPGDESYGVFSARYGNVYTARQAVQLFDRAYGAFAPADEAWQREEDGEWVDPYRPSVAAFASVDALRADREVHLRAVRSVFEGAAVVVFTLGLTEGWRARADGAVYPVVPGAAGGTFDPAAHEFVNFDVSEVITDVGAFADRVREVNPTVRVLLTVSPVPLIATYSDDHVLTATTYSKSVLRVAAAEVARARAFVDYFPAYEIITGPAAGGRYFAPDLRSVTDAGVAHVMRVFRRHLVAGGEDGAAAGDHLADEIARVGDVMCDEELLEG